METKLWFENICRKNNIVIAESQLELLEKFLSNLLEWNNKINLISRKDSENVWQQHILSSVSFLKYYDLRDGTSVLDLGTGGGLPGIPLAILKPDINFMLIDSIQKKIGAVQDILSKLNLPNVTVRCSRAEDLSAKKEFFQKFDYVVVRAVAPVKDLVRWGKPFLKHAQQDTLRTSAGKNEYIQTGTFIMLKGGDVTREIEEAKIKIPFQSVSVVQIIIDGLEQDYLVDKKIVILKP